MLFYSEQNNLSYQLNQIGCEIGNLNWIEDGYCDDELNNAGCGFDGGDCCGFDVNTAYCFECECLGESSFSKASPGPFCTCSVDGFTDCKLIDSFR